MKMKLIAGGGNWYSMDMGMGCGRAIAVSVEDTSHPLGIGGYRVLALVGGGGGGC
jgi:hypothetical protein